MSQEDVRRGGPLGALVDAARGSLWPVPALGIVVAVALGIGLPELDRALQGSGGQSLVIVFSGGPSAARDVLGAIAGSLISVTGLVFSLTVLALQLSSSQYSPRLLQTFVTDRVVQLTLAQLVMTFVYALTVMRTVRTESAASGGASFVPGISITVAYLLTLASVLALVLFLGHLSRSLRVETMLRDVHDEASATLERRGEPEPDPDASTPHRPPSAAWPVESADSGFLVGIDERAVVRAAREAGAVVLLAVRVGDGVVAGTPVGHTWAAGPHADLDRDELAAALNRGLELRYERQASRDVAYSLRKMVDIAVRALSPGTNDPTTAVHALSHVSALLGRLLVQPQAPRRLRDDDGVVRLVVPAWEPAALLDLALAEPVQFASGQIAVLRRVAALLREVAWGAPGRGVDAQLLAYADRVAERAARSTDLPADEYGAWPGWVADALAHRWPPAALS